MLKPLVVNARDAKTRFGELLDESLGRPVAITRHNRLVSYIVSKTTFEMMQARLELLEDQLLLAAAADARRDGFVSPEQVESILSTLSEAEDAGNKTDKAGARLP